MSARTAPFQQVLSRLAVSDSRNGLIFARWTMVHKAIQEFSQQSAWMLQTPGMLQIENIPLVLTS